MYQYSIYFDGASKGNPGKSGSAAVLYNYSSEVATVSKYIGAKKTNNEAEYNGLILGLTLCIQLNIKEVAIYGDSQLVVKQLLGEYAVKNERMKELHAQATELLSNFTNVHIEHVAREKNARADQLANEAIVNYKK